MGLVIVVTIFILVCSDRCANFPAPSCTCSDDRIRKQNDQIISVPLLSYLVGDAGDERLDVDGRGTRQLARRVSAFQTAAGLAHSRSFAAAQRAGLDVGPPPVPQATGAPVYCTFGVLRGRYKNENYDMVMIRENAHMFF